MKYIDDDALENKTIVITGGAGFVGSSIAYYIKEYYRAANIIIFDKFRNDEVWPNGNPKTLGHFKNIRDLEAEVIAADITNPKDLDMLEDFRADIIFHQAAISDTTVQDQELVIKTNTDSFINILNMALKYDIKVIYASSAGVYGNSLAPNVIGKGELPENVYGFSKLMMDKIAYDYIKRYPHMHIVGLRYFNVYGAREFYKGTTASMVLQLGLQALKHKKVRLFKHGEQKRDFVYIADVIQANIKALKSKRSGVYNIGYGKSVTFNEIIESLKSHFGDFEVEYIDNPYSFFQNYTQADIQSSQKHLDYKPSFDFKKGLQEYARDIQKHSLVS